MACGRVVGVAATAPVAKNVGAQGDIVFTLHAKTKTGNGLRNLLGKYIEL